MSKKAISLHRKLKGKIFIQSKISNLTPEILQLIYTPGVASVCKEIINNPNSKYTLTSKGNNIATKNKDTESNDFDIWLELLEKDNKIIVYEKNDIKKYHNARENILNQHDLLMMDINKKYIVLLKILLAYLFGFRLSKSDWEKRIKEYKQKLNL